MPTSRPPTQPDPPRPGSTGPVPRRDTTAPDRPVEETTGKLDHSVLGALERHAIERLTVTVASTVIDPDRPPVALAMLDLRERLMRGTLTQEAKDHAWRHLGGLARTQQGQWNLFALGTGYPKLRQQVDKLTAGMTWGRKQQTHYTIAIEFLFALHRLDLGRPWVFNRLVDAAYTHTSGRKRRRPEPGIRDLDTTSPYREPAATDGDPEREAEIRDNHRTSVRQALNTVVARANAAPGRQRITDRQAALIARTYLDGEPLRQVAADLGLSEPSASKQRRRAANVIARLLGRPDLADPPRPRTGPAPPAPAGQAVPAGRAVPAGGAG